jgi:hypothetical protein
MRKVGLRMIEHKSQDADTILKKRAPGREY